MSGQMIDEKTREFEGNDFDSSSNKRVKEISIDRLSALPDGILVHILSFLGVEKSAVTSVLSKRWRFIWVELPSLEFREHSAESEKRRDLVSRVNRTLLIRTGIHLEKFFVYFRYNHRFASDVDSWVDFVLKHKVKDVSLLVLGVYEENFEHYALPETMYSNSSLTRFSVGGCLMDTLTKIEWPYLACLHIDDSELPQHVVENFLSGCPLLHTLDLVECWGFNCLDVKSQNLCKLWVKDCEDGKNGPLLEIAAPYVHDLDLSFYSLGRKFVLRNIKSLVRARINFIEHWSIPNEVVLSTTTKELFEILKDVNELWLGWNYLEVLSKLVVNGWQLPISTKRKSLTIVTFINYEHNISGIFALLKFSPSLERFVIEGLEAVDETWDEAAGDLDCDLLHLKTVEISDFADPAFGGEPMLTVARNLLKRATVLEEMKVTLRLEETSDYVKIGLTLLNYPRSSKKAVVRFRYCLVNL